MTLEERVAELEKKVRELESRPLFHYVPVYPQWPQNPQPYWWYGPTCGSGSAT